jgi:hypothetical protein
MPWVAVPPDLARDLKAWVAKHPLRHDPRAFLFPTATGTAYRAGNFLKRVLTQPSQLEGFAEAKPFRISEGYPKVFTTGKGARRPILT